MWDEHMIVGKTPYLWRSVAQYAIADQLTLRAHEKTGYATVSKRELAAVVCLSVARVKQVIRELEALGAITRIGPDPRFGHKQRYIVHMKTRIARRHADLAGEVIAVDGVRRRPQGGARATPGEVHGRPQGGAPATLPVPAELKRYGEVQQIQEATAAPRLPLLGEARPAGPPEYAVLKDAQAAALQRRRERIKELARLVLHDEALGLELLGGTEHPHASFEAFEEAVKRFCAHKRIPEYGDLVRGVCASVYWLRQNDDVRRGDALRPRERRRARR